jgi:tetratricopeptide (TPR) repeat protein
MALSVARAATGDTLSPAFRQIQQRLCVAQGNWACALENLSRHYANNPELRGDTNFYFRAIGTAQTASDTAAIDHWTQEAIVHVDSMVQRQWQLVEQQRRNAMQAERALNSLRLARAALLEETGQVDSALAIYRTVWIADSSNARARILAAQLLTRDVGKTKGPLSASASAALAAADSLLRSAAGLTSDSLLLKSIAHSYLEVGARLVQNVGSSTIALIWLEQVARHDPDSTFSARANAYSALALLYLIEAEDTLVRSHRECRFVAREAALIERARAAIAPARELFPNMARRVLDGIRVYEELIPQYRAALRCRDP